jgi:hypothetical protein
MAGGLTFANQPSSVRFLFPTSGLRVGVLIYGSTLLSFPSAPLFREFCGRVGVQTFEAKTARRSVFRTEFFGIQ